MKVIQAAKAGFCFGVKRALEFAEKTVESQPTATLGPLIHNQQVVDRLQAKGIEVVETIDTAKNNRALIIRSHGVPPQVYQTAEGKGVKVVDATCPFVQKAQRLAAEAAENNQVIVVGDKQHPEVQGILGWAGHNAIALETVEEAERLPQFESITVLAQTTQPLGNFEAIVNKLKEHTDQLTIHNTICNATEERQRVAGELADQVDVMVVVGGRHSANTKKLAAICAGKTKTYHIETAAEIKNIWFEDCHIAGLTAGASTPDWIIEEVYKKMSEINEQDIKQETVTSQESQETQELETENGVESMESWDEDFQKLHRGAIVTGTVVKITDDEVFVDIGWKSEGVITLKELAVAPLNSPEEVVSIGDKISAQVLRVENEEGYSVLSRRRVAEAEAVDRLAQLAETKEELQAKVTEVVKGGVLVDIGMRGFVPASQVQLGYVEDLNQFIGQTLRLRIIDFDPSKKKVVLSQKVILAEEQATKREQLLAALQEGEIVKGEVRRLTNFGAFIDLGGVDGLLHISDMAYSRIKHPSDVVEVGDRVEVQVLSIDREKAKISLGLKQLKQSPWASAADKYPVGSVVNGKVVRIAPFGAFVQLEDGVDGLVHISQLAERRVAKVEDVVKVGDMISAKVIECKPEEKRISLSIREVAAEAEAALNQEALEEQTEAPPVTIGEVLGEKPEV